MVRATLKAITVVAVALSPSSAQTATVSGEVVLKEGGQPLAFTTVAVLPQGKQRLTSESGRFKLTDLSAGEIRLRFKRIGFAPRDTTLILAGNDTARIRVEMTRLIIQLPEMLVSGRCTNETPREPAPGFLTQLIDQVVQNSERMTLLAQAKPFQTRIETIEGSLGPDKAIIPTHVDTVLAGALPDRPYAPKQVMFVIPSGRLKGATGIMLPQLTDIADTAFTNNHCFRYAGRAQLGADSVIRVEFEPVPWLDREYDLTGTLYLKVDGYQMVGSFTRLNHITPQMDRAGIAEYFVDARFKEVLPGISVLDSWELVNRSRTSRPSFAQRSRVIAIEWKDSTGVMPRTVRRE